MEKKELRGRRKINVTLFSISQQHEMAKPYSVSL